VEIIVGGRVAVVWPETLLAITPVAPRAKRRARADALAAASLDAAMR